MPVDPTISLNVRPPDPGPLAGNPLQTYQTLTGIANTQQEMQNRQLEMQTRQNQIAQFNAQFGAMQKAGKLIAGAPDWDSAIKAIQSDPDAAFMLPTANLIREQMNTAAEIKLREAQTGEAGARTTEALTGAGRNVAETNKIGVDTGQSVLNGLVKYLVGASNDPKSAGTKAAEYLGALPGAAAQNILPTAKALVGSLDTSSPDAFRKDLAARLIGAGMGDAIPALLGGTSVQTGPSGVPTNFRGAPGLPLPGAPAGPGDIPTSNGAAATPAPPADTAKLSGLGTPLYAPIATAGPRVSTGTDLAGGAAKDLQTQHYGKGREVYQSALAASATLTDMDRALDALAADGGLATPGAGGSVRAAMANAINTMSQQLGGKPVVDPTSVGWAQLLQKDTAHLGFSTASLFLPGQEKAAQTIETSIDAVPGINNSVLGGKLLVASRQMAVQRAKDWYEFEDKWIADRGDARRADVEFNKAFPPEDYAKKVLDQYQIGTDGKFTNRQAVVDQFKQGYLTAAQAKRILDEQFPQNAKKK